MIIEHNNCRFPKKYIKLKHNLIMLSGTQTVEKNILYLTLQMFAQKLKVISWVTGLMKVWGLCFNKSPI